MSFLNPPYEDSFKELCVGYPLFYLDVFEMREILKAQGDLMNDLTASIELLLNNNFIATADEATIKTWEAALGIEYDNELTLEERKSVVAAHVSGHGHIGEPEIREVVSRYSPDPVTVAFEKGVITVTVSGEIFDTTNLYKTLLSRIPAHLSLLLNIIYGYATATAYVATAPASIDIVDGGTAKYY